MTNATLTSELAPIASRRHYFELWRRLAWWWAIVAALGLAVAIGTWVTGTTPVGLRAGLLALAGVGAVLVWRRCRRDRVDIRWIARQIESEHPKLHSLLLAALEQQPDPATGQLSYVQLRAVREAVAHHRKSPWGQRSIERLFFAQTAHWAALLLMLLTILAIPAPRTEPSRLATVVQGVSVSPGDVSIERGASLVVLARFEDVPREATLAIRREDGSTDSIPLVKNLDDPVFGATLPDVREPVRYWVEHEGQTTPEFEVDVFDYPALAQADAHLKFPAYTRLEERTIEDTHRISAVEGAELRYTFRLNKPVAFAALVGEDLAAPLSLNPGASNVFTFEARLSKSQRLDLRLVDFEGRTNRLSPQFVIDVLENRRPRLKALSPPGDTRVSPLEEVAFQGEASDDFGLLSHGIGFRLADGTPMELTLGDSAPAGESVSFAHLLPMEDLGVAPRELISYFLWADDVGPDGETRRTFGDMFFVEVRPLEEIFREAQGASPQNAESAQQSGGQSNPAVRLAELQKEIITASWNLQRRDNTSQMKRFSEDAKVIQESQAEALNQVGELADQADDPAQEPLIELAQSEMKKAIDHLEEASKEGLLSAMGPALAAEQAAYSAILKLGPDESQVAQGQGGGGGGGGGQRSQMQLDQLELQQSDNRYETERQASAAQQSEQAEQLQVLNRLKELAQRQKDVNERLKDVQSALASARTPQEEEEARRQLKRLQEEERQLLSDLDHLRQRMARQDSPETAQSLSQLDQTRSEVQRAAEELERESISQAAASGTRAERKLDELEDDFRRQTSSQFAEAMRDLRLQARELTDRQEQLAKGIEELKDPARRSLRETPQKQQVADQLENQKEGVKELLSGMQDVVQQAEAAEPLLSQKLYDAMRMTDPRQLDDTLEEAAKYLRHNFIDQASLLEGRARESIESLAAGVERAAESVLGDEVESLRRAERELAELSRQLNEEIARGQGAPNAQGENGLAENQDPSAAQGNSARPANEGDPSQGGGQNSELASEGRNGRPGESGAGSEPGSSPADQAQQASAQGSESPGQGQGQGQAQTQAQAQGQGEGQGRGQGGQSGSGGNPNGENTEQPGDQTPRLAQESDGSRQPGQGGNGGGSRSLAEGGNRRFGDSRGANGGTWGGDLGELIESMTRGGPLTGSQFSEWSERLADVEQMIDSPELRREISRIRERARAERIEVRRHGKAPEWELVRLQIAEPLAEAREWVQEELARRTSDDSLAPIDRDPVPAQFSELVRQYYEELGSAR